MLSNLDAILSAAKDDTPFNTAYNFAVHAVARDKSPNGDLEAGYKKVYRVLASREENEQWAWLRAEMKPPAVAVLVNRLENPDEINC